MSLPRKQFDAQRIASLVIQHDDDPIDPRRDYDNMGVMACWHRRGSYGDDRENKFRHTPASEWLEPWGTRGLNSQAWLASLPKGTIVLPLFMMDHSGVTIRTSCGSFQACDPQGWDWGQLGVIVATPAAIRNNFGVKRITKKIRERAEKVLQSEVETYDLCLTGQCWGYVITDAEGEEDACWGFFGDTLESTGLKDALPDAAIPLLEEAWAARK